MSMSGCWRTRILWTLTKSKNNYIFKTSNTMTTMIKTQMEMTDGYKLDHRRQYPKGTEFVYSN